MARLRFISLVAFMVLGCGATSGICAASGPNHPAKYPNIEIREEGETTRTTRVYWDGQILVDFKDNRWVRFRATPADENWIGSEKSRMDLGWVYRDEGAKGMVVLKTNHENDPKTGRFVLRISGKKPQFDSRIEVVLTGTWMPEAGKFKYTLNTRLSCPLESWYEHSAFAPKQWTEVFDYCIEGISVPERLMATKREYQKWPLMYEWFVKSTDGKAWEKWPKVHIPYPVHPGDYITIHERARPLTTGSYYGHLDSKAGGWMTRVSSAPSPVIHEICWARFDVHVQLEGAIPPRHSAKDLALAFEMAFEPVDAVAARKIIEQAAELPWRKAPEYNMPLFAWDNRFDKLITDVPGEETAQHLMWWGSDYACDRDSTTGYDDQYSATIKRDEKSTGKSSAWSTLAWRWPFNEHKIYKRRIRISARVKTKDCAGSVRLGHYRSEKDLGDMYYGGAKSHQKDRTPKTDGIVWEYSKSLTGATDWTPLTLEFVGMNYGSTIMLEQVGSGQCWFDNVKIEDLGNAQPERANK